MWQPYRRSQHERPAQISTCAWEGMSHNLTHSRPTGVGGGEVYGEERSHAYALYSGGVFARDLNCTAKAGHGAVFIKSQVSVFNRSRV